MNEAVVIEVMNGPEDGKLVTCDQSPISIGRAEDNVLRLAFDHLISRHHALVRISEGSFILCDLHSTNGIFVGDERVTTDTVIAPGKLFRVGATVLRIKIGSPGPPSVTEED
jgi:pSer/pThr/pTyr-binding forkhead associated (FHA) protein